MPIGNAPYKHYRCFDVRRAKDPMLEPWQYNFTGVMRGYIDPIVIVDWSNPVKVTGGYYYRYFSHEDNKLEYHPAQCKRFFELNSESIGTALIEVDCYGLIVHPDAKILLDIVGRI